MIVEALGLLIEGGALGLVCTIYLKVAKLELLITKTFSKQETQITYLEKDVEELKHQVNSILERLS